MKRYELLKDLPFAKAGGTFSLHRGGIKDCITLFKGDEEVYTIKVGENVSEMFDEWFEEVREYFYIDSKGDIEYSKNEWNEEVVEHHKLIGNYFETREEAEKYLEYLKAKVIIKQDTKGFKPDWKDIAEDKYYGYLHFEKIEFGIAVKENKFGRERMNKTTTIYFQSEEDIKDSLEKHPEEWRVYLTYEQ